MNTQTRNDSNDRDGSRLSSRPQVQGKARAILRCRLCGQSIVLESNFRPTPAQCPHCGVKFVFDPQEEPLPVRGMRLRTSEVVDAQRRGRGCQHRRHEAHVPAPVVMQRPKTNYLAWLGSLAFAAAGLFALVRMFHGR